MKPVLVIAEAANPEWSSVPLVGWSLARALFDRVPAHIVTHVRNRDAFVRHGMVEGTDFTAIDNEAIAGPLHKLSSLFGGKSGKGWTTMMALNLFSYRYFEKIVERRFGAAIAAGNYRAVHRVTPLSPTLPSRLAGFCRRHGVPFHLGPLNGGLRWPPGYRLVAFKEREFLSFVRSVYKILPGRGSTLRNATRVFVGSKATLADIPKRHHHKCVHMPENGLDPARFSTHRTRRAEVPLKLIFVGRLVPYKGPDVALEAAASILQRGAATMEIVGDGPMRAQLTAFATQLGVESRVTFTGWVEHSRVQEHLASSDVFVFPSVREFGGAAPLEAMAVGVPPIVVDYGGPGEIVTDTTGWRIALGPRADLIRKVADCLERIVGEPSIVDRLGDAARAHVWPVYSWSAKADAIVREYESVERIADASIA